MNKLDWRCKSKLGWPNRSYGSIRSLSQQLVLLDMSSVFGMWREHKMTHATLCVEKSMLLEYVPMLLEYVKRQLLGGP